MSEEYKTARAEDNKTSYARLGCPYQEECRDYGRGLCLSCRHRKASYYEPITPSPPVYPYIPYISYPATAATFFYYPYRVIYDN